MSHQKLLWISFNLFILLMLVVDLGLFHRRTHAVKVREALIWSAVWIALALIFNAGIFHFAGRDPALKFFTGWLLEKSLSVDNLFVFLLIFNYFKVPPAYQHKVLFWGILGALILRAIFIFSGIALIQKFHWLFYVLGAFLIFTGIRLAFEKGQEVHPEKNPVILLVRKFFPVTQGFEGSKFLVKKEGRIYATPLLLILLVIETTDLIFAVDSVPAILAISQDSFIVYSSNVFAILGLRSLYFALSGIMEMFHHLHYGLSFILVFVGVKMVLSDYLTIPIWIALSVIGGVLILSIIASLIWPQRAEPPARTEND